MIISVFWLTVWGLRGLGKAQSFKQAYLTLSLWLLANIGWSWGSEQLPWKHQVDPRELSFFSRWSGASLFDLAMEPLLDFFQAQKFQGHRCSCRISGLSKEVTCPWKSPSVSYIKISNANPRWSRNEVTIFEKQSDPHTRLCPGFCSPWGLILFHPFLRHGIAFPILVESFTSFKTHHQDALLCDGFLQSSETIMSSFLWNHSAVTPFTVGAVLYTLTHVGVSALPVIHPRSPPA